MKGTAGKNAGPGGAGGGGRSRAPLKGRGTASNPPGRYEVRKPAPLDPSEESGATLWDGIEEDEEPRPATVVTPDATRTIIARNDSPDIPFDRSVNPYRGCEHGCIYCFARPSHAFLGLSPGLDFETRIIAKPEAARLLAAELARPGYVCDVMALGSNTDPYQPVERKMKITRGVLEVLAAHHHPVTIVTKSDLVLRDADLLAAMARQRLASVMISITTLDPALARRMEPRAAAPHRRVETIRELNKAGIPAGVLNSPIIPGLNDTEIERVLEACAEAGARWAGYTLVRLPYEVKDLFREWLEEHYPLRSARILGLVRQTRSGALNDPAYGSRMRGRGALADLIRNRFAIARRRFGLDPKPAPLDTSQFRVPGAQASLF